MAENVDRFEFLGIFDEQLEASRRRVNDAYDLAAKAQPLVAKYRNTMMTMISTPGAELDILRREFRSMLHNIRAFLMVMKSEIETEEKKIAEIEKKKILFMELSKYDI